MMKRSVGKVGDRVAEALLEDELAPAVIGTVARNQTKEGRDLERLTGSSVGGTVESFTSTMGKGA